MKRVFLIVLDSFGIGQMPDAAAYGDINVNTLRSVSRSPYFHMENMKNMGCLILTAWKWERKQTIPRQLIPA